MIKIVTVSLFLKNRDSVSSTEKDFRENFAVFEGYFQETNINYDFNRRTITNAVLTKQKWDSNLARIACQINTLPLRLNARRVMCVFVVDQSQMGRSSLIGWAIALK